MEIGNNSKQKFLVLSLVYLILTIADFGLTYIGTPNLLFEGNPLVTLFGFGWSALIIINLAILPFYIWLTYISFVGYKRSIIQCEGIKQYISIILYNRPDKFEWIIWKFPVNKKAWICYLAAIGYAISISFIIYRIILVIEWITFITKIYRVSYIVDWYHNYLLPIPKMLHLLLLIGGFLIYWYYKEFKINQHNCEAKSLNESKHENI